MFECTLYTKYGHVMAVLRVIENAFVFEVSIVRRAMCCHKKHSKRVRNFALCLNTQYRNERSKNMFNYLCVPLFRLARNYFFLFGNGCARAESVVSYIILMCLAIRFRVRTASMVQTSPSISFFKCLSIYWGPFKERIRARSD